MPDATGVFNEISGALDALANQAVALVGEDRSFMEMWAWNMPAINRHEFADILRQPIQTIQSITDKQVNESDLALLQQYPARIQFLLANALPQLPGGNSFHVYLTATSLIEGLHNILEKYAAPDIDWKTIEDRKLIPAAQLKRLKQLATGISKLSLESGDLAAKIVEINGAHSAAEALPTDMESLNEARKAFTDAVKVVERDQKTAATAKDAVEARLNEIVEFRTEAEKQVQNIEAAYSAATNQGLGKAFGDKAVALSRSTWGLGVLLFVTLAIAAGISSQRIEYIHKLMLLPTISMQLLWVNVTLTLVSVAAPIWFAWLLTKQIGQRFRLSEDYGFKASVAKAYEGYRREAARVDPELEKRLFQLALDRLEEAPLRLVERDSHGSPWQDLFSGFSKRSREQNSSTQA